MATQIEGLQALHPCDAEAVAHIISKLARGDMGTAELDYVLDLLARAGMGGGNHPLTKGTHMASFLNQRGKATKASARKPKYNARGIHAHGMYFSSKGEHSRFLQLTSLLNDGRITHLEFQPRFRFAHNGIQLGYYDADFRYNVADEQRMVVEDVKGMVLPVYKMKRKMLAAWYPEAWQAFQEIPSKDVDKKWMMRIPDPGECRPKKP